MKTIHLILNAHLDPVWLWPWTSGLDEALATCRSACDRLDAHPDLRFSRGEAWVYRQVERLDPALFERIRAHVASGRWEIVGGWWLQPDCNLPSKSGFEAQIALGRSYFESRFGVFPDIAFNVDSFGHAATLPAILREAGQKFYVMMRPQEHEMTLPARLFRWRGFEGGPQVTTFRIAKSYNTGEISLDHLRAALEGLPDGVNDTMCFVGVGNHGGGPTERQIAWLRQHWDAVPDARLEFSTIQRFFAAISAYAPALPLVTGELQQHAVGCYSVFRPVKVASQRAEIRLEQAATAEKFLGAAVSAHEDGVPSLESAWERVCFAHFHDTLGGTCLPSAYPPILDALGLATCAADDRIQFALRRHLNALPDDERQRLVLFNASDAPFEAPVEVEPWLGWQAWQGAWQLRDENGDNVPVQAMAREALSENESRLVFRARLEAGQIRVLAIDRSPTQSEPPPVALPARSSAGFVGHERAAWTRDALVFGANRVPLPFLLLLDDPTDTWSHGIQSYGETGAPARWEAGETVDQGPILASLVQNGTIGDSRLRAEWRVYADEPFVELWLRIHWNEGRKILKLNCPLAAPACQRTDGISGAALTRASDGRELPLRDWTRAQGEDAGLGVVCPDVFALDGTPDRLRLTLLRASLLAHHDPHPGITPRGILSDQGEHLFRFRFFLDASQELLESHARALHKPPIFADLTRGMPAHLSETEA